MDNEITVIELKQRLDKGEDLLVIDVRESYEFDEFNIGARLIPLGNLATELHDLDDFMDNEIVVHCRSGARSAAAQDYMRKQGFEKVRNLAGGILAWQEAFQV
jgi:rhodanese-related sulfurtransferase